MTQELDTDIRHKYNKITRYLDDSFDKRIIDGFVDFLNESKVIDEFRQGKVQRNSKISKKQITEGYL